MHMGHKTKLPATVCKSYTNYEYQITSSIGPFFQYLFAVKLTLFREQVCRRSDQHLECKQRVVSPQKHYRNAHLVQSRDGRGS